MAGGDAADHEPQLVSGHATSGSPISSSVTLLEDCTVVGPNSTRSEARLRSVVGVMLVGLGVALAVDQAQLAGFRFLVGTLLVIMWVLMMVWATRRRRW